MPSVTAELEAGGEQATPTLGAVERNVAAGELDSASEDEQKVAPVVGGGGRVGHLNQLAPPPRDRGGPRHSSVDVDRAGRGSAPGGRRARVSVHITTNTPGCAMADSTFTFRVDQELKAAFADVAAAQEHTAAQLLRV